MNRRTQKARGRPPHRPKSSKGSVGIDWRELFGARYRSIRYADQCERDDELIVAAARKGEIEVFLEEA